MWQIKTVSDPDDVADKNIGGVDLSDALIGCYGVPESSAGSARMLVCLG